MKGLFITYEGLDGSGKTTQIKLIYDFLIKAGFDVVLTREPGGTKIGDLIRKILLDKKNSGMSYRAETLLFLASRAELVLKVIEPAIKEGKIVICDRFFDSTVVYQGIARELGEKEVLDMSLWATNGIIPDLTFLLSASTDICDRRISSASKGKDRIEVEKNNFKEKIYKGYLDVAKKNRDRFIVIDGDEGIESIFATVKESVLKLLKLKGLMSNVFK
jgi:dTMP kinase